MASRAAHIKGQRSQLRHTPSALPLPLHSDHRGRRQILLRLFCLARDYRAQSVHCRWFDASFQKWKLVRQVLDRQKSLHSCSYSHKKPDEVFPDLLEGREG